jgi:hypothetical protein
MNLHEIKRAVSEGLVVYWGTRDYVVEHVRDGDRYFIKSLATGHAIALTWSDGLTLNGKEEEFFVDP